MLYFYLQYPTLHFYENISINTSFLIDGKLMQLNLDNKVKAFHESISGLMKCPSNCIS